MRTIGLLGGMSWESSLEYYRLVNEALRDRLGGLHSARCVLFSVDFAEIEALQMAGDWQAAGAYLARAALQLTAAGAEVIVLCTNTMHKVAAAIEAAVDVPLLHIADPTATAIKRAGFGRIGLLGTSFTMEQDFYKDRLESHGLQVIVPAAEDRALVHTIIYEELCLGLIRDASRTAYQAVIERLVTAGAEAIILGCTEIGLLIKPADSLVTVFDTTVLHAHAAVDCALAEDA